jgi:hypothetical protein
MVTLLYGRIAGSLPSELDGIVGDDDAASRDATGPSVGLAIIYEWQTVCRAFWRWRRADWGDVGGEYGDRWPRGLRSGYGSC